MTTRFDRIQEMEHTLRAQGLSTAAIHTVRRAMPDAGLDNACLETFRAYVEGHTDAELRGLRNLGRGTLAQLRQWERAGAPAIPNWAGEGVPA